jgi:hypothetical protein
MPRTVIEVPRLSRAETLTHVSGIADVNLLRYANVLLLRAKARAGKGFVPTSRQQQTRRLG